jgi:hypothetical protein
MRIWVVGQFNSLLMESELPAQRAILTCPQEWASGNSAPIKVSNVNPRNQPTNYTLGFQFSGGVEMNAI